MEVAADAPRLTRSDAAWTSSRMSRAVDISRMERNGAQRRRTLERKVEHIPYLTADTDLKSRTANADLGANVFAHARDSDQRFFVQSVACV